MHLPLSIIGHHQSPSTCLFLWSIGLKACLLIGAIMFTYLKNKRVAGQLYCKVALSSCPFLWHGTLRLCGSWKSVGLTHCRAQGECTHCRGTWPSGRGQYFFLFSFFFWSIVQCILSQIRNNRCSFWWQILAAQWQKKNNTEILSEMPGSLTKIFPKKLGEFLFLKNYYHFLTAPKSMSPPCYSLEKTLDGLLKTVASPFLSENWKNEHWKHLYHRNNTFGLGLNPLGWEHFLKYGV